MKKHLMQWYKSASSLWDDDSASRLYWLVVTRMMILFVLLVLAVFMESRIIEPFAVASLQLFYGLITFAFLFSLVYLMLIRNIRRVAFHIYLQSLLDVCLITGLVYVTGGVRSVYPVLYPLVIIYSVIFLGRRGGLIVASASSIFYGLFVNLEFHGFIQSLQLQPEATTPDDRIGYGDYVFFRVLIHILSFYIITIFQTLPNGSG